MIGKSNILIKTIDTRTYPGKGLAGKLEGIDETIRVGTVEWLLSEGVILDFDIEKTTIGGETIIAVAKGEQLLGLILVDDQIRAEDICISQHSSVVQHNRQRRP